MSKILKQFLADFRKYCETTSVRGIPRIFKTQSRVVRVVWILAVLGCFAMLLWQISLILIRYFNYPTSINTVQAPAWQTPTFPDITVCNQTPLVYENYFSMSYVDYIGKLNKNNLYEAFPNEFSDLTPDDYEKIYAALALPTTYLNNFPLNLAYNGSDSMILECSYFDWNYNQLNSTCTATVYASWDSDYYKCFTLRPADADRGNIRGFSGIIIVDDVAEDQAGLYVLDVRSSRASGVQVLVHPPGTTPDMSLGMSISPGTEASIMLQQTTRIRLPDPYSNCTTQKSVKGDYANVTYTQDYCVAVCLEQLYIDRCGCVSGDETCSMPQLQSVNFTLCSNISAFEQDSTKFYCYTNNNSSTDADVAACNAQCFVPCQEYIYDARLSTADWPQASSLYSFYATFLANQARFGPVFDDAFAYIVENIGVANNSDSVRESLENLTNIGLVSDRFLQLNVMFGSPKFNQLMNVASYPVETMGAQIGGQLALYMGVSIMFAFETFEFIYTFIVNACKANSAQPN